jgi:phasin family protein
VGRFRAPVYAEGQAALKQLAAARSPKAAFEVQTAYLKGSTERLMAQAKVLQDLYAGLAGTLAKPQGTTASA